jgi:dipeptidyl aminopeptidase/acylaminoacyl peptidase
MNRMLTLPLCFALLATPSLAARFTVDDVARVVHVSDPQISPDGKSIVVVVGRPNLKTDTFESELVLVDIASKAQRLLTQGRVVKGYPRWSPTGDRLAYIAEDADKKSQVFLLPMAGGDSLQLTHAAGAVTQFAWKPDGSAIAFAAEDEKPKREGEAKFEDAFEVGANDSLVDGPSMPTHIWLIPSTGGDAKRLTSGTWSLPVSFPPGSPSSPINWTPDGKQIAFVEAVTPLSGDAEHTQMELLDLATGQATAVTKRTLYESYPILSPDGANIAYWYPIDSKAYNINEVRVVSTTGANDHSETSAIDRNIERALWTSDSKSLLVGANDGTTLGLWLKPLAGAPRRLDLGNLTPASVYWVDINLGPKDELALVGTTPERAAELYYMPTLTSAPVRLTGFNSAFDSLDRGKSETVTWVSEQPSGKKELDGVVTYPPDFSPGEKYPLVLYVHGGPNSASKQTFNLAVQLMAAQGWVIFEPNYRGSDNMGNAFYASIYKDAGEGPGRDVMAGVDMLEKRGFVDTSRLAVSGWSYGGYMTTWLLGHYNVWKAAVAGAAVTDWVAMYAISDGNVTISDQVSGSPYTAENMKSYVVQSPMNFAPNIHAPTLILHDLGDTRVPIANSYELFRALKDNGVTTQFFVYPVSGHSPADPIRQRDIRKRWIEWLATYIGSDAPPSPAAPAPATK